MGLPPPPAAETAVQVLPDNWPVVRAFLACNTQWRLGPGGYPSGLDYSGCRVAVKALGLGWRKVFEGLRVMELETLQVLARQARQ